MKPKYQVPTMEEIKAIPWNGFNVASTFAGAGGSSLGYRMAGFRVLYANEFIPAARETYLANSSPFTKVDDRDIRDVRPEDILRLIGVDKGELDILDGSPPCAAFSTAGSGASGWGVVRHYSDTKQRVDDLFYEFARILHGVQPKVFVAENVPGLTQGRAAGYFNNILGALKDCGYVVSARIVEAQWLGVPQNRRRLIFMGVRSDLGLAPEYPSPNAYSYSIRDAIPWIDNEANNPFPVEPETCFKKYSISSLWDETPIGGAHRKRFSLVRPDPDKPSNTLVASGASGTASITHPFIKRKFSIAELKRLSSFPDDFIVTGNYSRKVERLGRAVPPVMMSYIAASIRDKILRRL